MKRDCKKSRPAKRKATDEVGVELEKENNPPQSVEVASVPAKSQRRDKELIARLRAKIRSLESARSNSNVLRGNSFEGKIISVW